MIKCVSLKLLVMLLIVISFSPDSYANNIQTIEYKLKALYIIRLAAFITWPETLEKQNFKICIDSSDPVAIQLKKSNFTHIKEQQLEIIDPADDHSIKLCKFLYYSQGRVDSLLRNSPVVTLSSQADFARQGGMIEFYVDQSKVKMKVNLQAVNLAGIKLSSKLVRLLKIVKKAEESDD